MVRVEDIQTEHEFFWGKDKFLDRQGIMEEMYDKFEEGEDWKLPPVSKNIILHISFDSNLFWNHKW